MTYWNKPGWRTFPACKATKISKNLKINLRREKGFIQIESQLNLLIAKCEEFKFRGLYDAAFRLGQETRQILFEFQQTRWASRSKSRSRSQDVSSLALYRRRIPKMKKKKNIDITPI